MALYHLYSLRGAELVGRDELHAENDDAAMQAARSQGRGDHVEIWREDRRIRTVVPHRAA